jgi:gluconate kinase
MRRRARRVIYTLLQTAKLNNVDPHAWLADVRARINNHKITDQPTIVVTASSLKSGGR